MSDPKLQEKIIDALKTVQDPDLHKDIVSLGFVKNMQFDGGKVKFDVELTTPACPVKEQLKTECETKVQAIDGVDSVDVNMTAVVRSTQHSQPVLSGVKNIIAVASGKGGVGKSTVSTNLAIALSMTGAKVGLMDADIYGPSTPTMLGVKEAPWAKYKKIEPAVAHGIKLMSIGFYVPEDAAMIWRGPMIMKALDQFIFDVEWGDLDVLVVDLPPGTGDAQLSLAQRVPVDGVVIVTTPSDVALIDARRGLEMFKKINVRVLGIVENMSFFLCPHCGERTNVFSAGGGKETAEKIGTKFLGEIPLDPFIRHSGDAGNPAVAADVSSPQAVRFNKMTDNIWEEINDKVPAWDKNGCHFFGLPKDSIPVKEAE